MEFPRQITMIQTTIILVSTIIGVGILAIPRIAVVSADTGAPLTTLLGIFVASIGLWLVALLGMRFPNKTIIQYGEDILGKWLARIGSVLIILFFAVLTALASREFGEVVITSVLRDTPLEITVIVMLLLAAVSTRNDTTTFAFIHHFYFPLILFPALLIVALSLKNANVLHLQPIWGNEPGGMITGILTVAALFQGFFILTMVIPAMRRPEKAMLSSVFGMSIAGGLYLLIVIATVSVFGAEETKVLLWPTLELAKMTSLPGKILERLDAAFLAVWVTAVFTTLFSSYFLTIHSISQLFNLRDHKMFSLMILPFVFVFAMIPQNILQMYEIIEIVGRIGLLITIGYPSLLLAVALIRKKRGDQRAGKQSKQMEKTN
jgi:spore germination protein